MKSYSQLTIIELIKELRREEELALSSYINENPQELEQHHQNIYKIYVAIGYRYARIK